MNHYQLRRNFVATCVEGEKSIRGKVAFKTKESDWLSTTLPVITLVSVHSAFHKDMNGDFKMNAFISTIKQHVKGNMAILLAETAHLQALRLSLRERALGECLKSAQELTQRYQAYFDGCNLLSWHSSICQDKNYPLFLEQVERIAATDERFQHLLLEDAKATYTITRREETPDEAPFIQAAIADILGQCACMLVLIERGYRYQFYPGAPNRSTEYLQEIFVSEEKRLHWVNVFLSIEKKSLLI